MLAATIAACGTDSEGGSDDEIKIGLLVPQTGAGSSLAEPMSNSVEMAVDEINDDGGVDGQMITVIEADDATDPRVTLQAARKLLQEDQVDALFGTFTGIEFAPALKAATAAEKLFFFGTYGSAEGQPCGGVRVHLGQRENQQNEPWVPHLVEEYGPQFYAVGSTFPYPEYVVDHLKDYLDEHGGELVGEDFYPLGTTDFSKSLQSINKVKPDVVFSVVGGADLFTFAKQYKQFGVEAQLASPIYDDRTVSALQGTITGAATNQSWVEALDTPENQDFVRTYRERYGQDFHNSPVGEALYDGVHLYAAAVGEAGTTDKAEVADALTEVSFDAPQGPVRITESQLGLAMVTNSIIAKVNDRGGLDVVEVLGQIEPEDTGEGACEEEY